MIGALRRFAKSKWALVLLFIPLVISLGVFLPDTFGMGGGQLSGGVLSRIGGREVKVTEVDRDVQRLIDEVRNQEGRIISQADAAREGRVGGIINDLEIRNTLLAYADKVGIQASAESLKPYLERNKILVNEFGKLSRDAILYQASQRRQTTKEFEQFIRDFLTQDYIREAAGAALTTPDVLSQPWINYLGESRTMRLAQVTNATVAAPAEPTEAELQAWYDTHKANFQQPERRRISVLTYSPDDFLDKVELTDAELQAEYEKRIADYSTPETRTLVEFTSNDRNAVQSFIDLTAQGIAVDQALAQTTGLTRTETVVKPEDLTEQGWRDFVFGLPVDKVYTQPIRDKDSDPWKAAMVSKIVPGIPTPLEQIRDKVRRDVAWNDASAMFENSSEPFLDAAGGQPLEDIGKQFGIPVIQLAPVDAQARTQFGDQAQLLTQNPDSLRQLFSLSAGDMTNVVEGDNVRTMFRLDEVIAPYVLPFAEVKDRVKLSIMSEKVTEAANAAADAVVAAVTAGTAFEKAATDAKLSPLPQPLTILRFQAQQSFDPAVIGAAFGLEAGKASVVRGRDGKPWVALVDKIEPVTPEIATALRAQLQGEIQQSLLQDLNETFVLGLRSEVEYKRDDAAVQQYLQGMIGDKAQQ
jgi:peptidyl-prolyl cis-trans isomerase D